jgi:uncharacterized protein YcfL
MKTLQTFFLAVVVAFLLTSCASQRTYPKLHPIDQEVVWENGKEIVKDEKDGLKVVLSHDGFWKNYMVFDVEIFNKSEQPITITPKNFFVIPLSANRDSLRSQDGKYIYEYQAIEPQEKMAIIQSEMQEADAKIKRARIVNTALFIGGFIAILAASGGKSESAWRTASIGETAIQVAQVKRVIDHENYYSKMDNLNGQANTWANEEFRATTLAPNTSIRGGVFIEKNLNAKFLLLKYNTPNNAIHFTFEQVYDVNH